MDKPIKETKPANYWKKRCDAAEALLTHIQRKSSKANPETQKIILKRLQINWIKSIEGK